MRTEIRIDEEMEIIIFVSFKGNQLTFETSYDLIRDVTNENEKVEIKMWFKSKEAEMFYENLKRLKAI